MNKRSLNLKRPYVSLFILSALMLNSCGPSQTKNNILSKLGMDGIYSTRPQTGSPVIAILKLKSPALLETATRKDGKLVIDEDLQKAILAEQEDTIKSLEEISTQIKVLIRYKLVLNGLTIWAPPEVLEDIRSLPNVISAERSTQFARPILDDEEDDEKFAVVGTATSVKYIGAEEAYKQGILGQGMKVGVIDTGIDYTHKMLGGEGTPEAYKAIKPNEATPAFPNKKVVGGIDLVGTKFDSASPEPANRVPVPDLNPLDEAKHGTHVAGTVAGIGDGVNTYSGVAPEALLYAIKVFGASGSTSDEVVIAALEYAINPSGDGKFEDQLDVVNLSLGSGYGSPHIMYGHAIKNTVRGGTIVVASGGNSGDKGYIVGAPGVADDAISVASSVDNMLQNLEFGKAELIFANGEKLAVEAIEGDGTKKLETITELKGELVAVGLASEELNAELSAAVKGKIALIDRGGVTFAVKVERAFKAGAIAAVVANNNDEDPNPMTMGDKKFDIPAVMISKNAGAAAKEQLNIGPVIMDLKPEGKFLKPWLEDTISSFSSRGPRSEDGMIKPEISSPGSNIISAGRGTGDKGIYMSGTSMAGPHIAGVMALLKQKFTKLDAQELKSTLLGHAKPIADKDKKTYTISRQGAGRVQIGESLKAQVVSVPATLSFGLTDIEKQKTISEVISVKNISDKEITLDPEWVGSAALKLTVSSVTLAPGEAKNVLVTARVVTNYMKQQTEELDGWLKFKSGKETVLSLPALAVVRQISQVTAKSAVVQSTSAADGAGSTAEITLHNAGLNKGDAYLFNLIGTDARKSGNKMDLINNRNCDLQSAGYRIIERKGVRILQVAAKLYEGMTTWHACEVNIQLDSNNDGIADQEVAGTTLGSLAGLTGDNFVSLLIDANKARDLRKAYEAEFKKDPKKAAQDYSEAAIAAGPMKVFDGATLAILDVELTDLPLSENGDLKVKISTTHEDYGAIEYDDYLGDANEWKSISTTDMGQVFVGLPEVVSLAPSETATISVKKGYSINDLILYAPQNRAIHDTVAVDSQSQVVPVTYSSK